MDLSIVTTVNRKDQRRPSPSYSDLSIVSMPPGNPTMRILHTAGQVGTPAAASSPATTSFHDQAKNAFFNVAACLALVGATPRHITKINIYVVNYEPSMRDVLVDVITNFFTSSDSEEPHRPPSTLLGVAALAIEDSLIEVDAEAVVAVPP